jgi:hypothetical protein
MMDTEVTVVMVVTEVTDATEAGVDTEVMVWAV